MLHRILESHTDEGFGRNVYKHVFFLSTYIYIYKDIHKKKTSLSSLNLCFFSSILDAFRRYGHRQENEFLQGCMPFYSRFSSHVMLMRSHGLKLVM